MRVKNELWCSNELQALQKKPLILPKFVSDSGQSVTAEWPLEPLSQPAVQAQRELWRSRVLGSGCSHLCWQQVTSSYGKEQGQSKDVQLFIWLCLLGRRGVWRVFSYCTGQGSMSWSEPLPGSPQRYSRAALLAGGVLFFSLFIFFPFSPSVMQTALDFPTACSFTSRKTSLGTEGEKKEVLAMRSLTFLEPGL